MRPEDLERAKELVERLKDLQDARKFYLKKPEEIANLNRGWLFSQTLIDRIQNEILSNMNRRIKYVQKQLDAI